VLVTPRRSTLQPAVNKGGITEIAQTRFARDLVGILETGGQRMHLIGVPIEHHVSVVFIFGILLEDAI
jgi:hypothetical protein